MAQATVSVTFPQDYSTVRLVYSTASDLSNPSYSGVNATTNKTAKITVTGLNSLTTYYYGVEVNGALQTAGRGQFKTFPTSGSATNFTCAFASCSNSGSNSTIFTTIKNYNPAFFIHMGDFHYENIASNDITLYRSAYDMVFAQPNPASLYANIPTVYMWDDHDYGEDVTANGDGNNKNNIAKVAAHAAYRERVPHYTLAGTAQEPIYQSFVYGRIRFIVLDIHTAKDRYTDADSSAKTMLGATQKAWLKNQLIQPEPVKVIVNGQPWIDTANDDDNWTYYATERKEIMDYIKTNNLMDKVMMFSGDMHAVAIDDGTNNNFATGGGKGFPVFQAAPLDQNPTTKGGPYTYGPYAVNNQFGLMTVTDNGSTISVQWTGKRGTTDIASLSLTFSGAAYAVDTTAPNEVTNLASSNLTSTGATITWTASTSTDVANYLVYNGASLLATLGSAATSYNLTGLSASTAYTITVKGKDNVGNISTGANVTFTTASAADTTPPNEVTNLAVTNNNTGTSLTLSWTASTSSDIASYDVYNGATFLGNVTATTYGVTGLTRGSSYTFYVKAKDTSGNVSTGVSIAATATDTTAPINVTNLATSNVTGTSLTLSWTASSSTDVASYDVFNGATLLGNTSSTTYNVSGLSGSTSYTFYVKAKDQAGNIASGTSVSVTTGVAVSVAVSDSFNRTGLLAGTTTDNYQGGTALTWAVSGSGAYSTNGTTAYCSTTAATGHNVAYVDTGYADGSCEILLSTQELVSASGPKICFRIQDSENMLVCSLNDSINVYAYVGGSSTADLGKSTLIPQNGDRIKVTTSGTNITVFLNDTQVISCTDTATTFTNNTKWGFTSYKQPNARIDNFIFSTVLDTTPPNNVTGLTSSNVTQSGATLSWTASTSTDIASYNVYNGATLLGNTSTTSYNVTGLSASTSYTFYVKAKDKVGNVASGTSITVTTPAPAPGTMLISDSFNRTATTTSLGTTDSYAGGTAKPWTVLGTNGTYGIDANGYAYASTQATTGHNVAVVDVGQSDYTIECQFAVIGSGESPKLSLKVQDQENMLMLEATSTNYHFFCYSTTGVTNPDTNITGAAPANGDVVKVICKGSNYDIYVNGIFRQTATSTAYQTATKCGIMAYHYPNTRFDNFKVSVNADSTVMTESFTNATWTGTSEVGAVTMTRAGNWSLSGGKIYASDSGGDEVYATTNYSDGIAVSVDIGGLDVGGSKAAWVSLRFNPSDSSHILVQITGNNAFLVQNYGATQTTIASGSITYVSGGTLKASIKGNLLNVYYNGTQIVTNVSTTFNSTLKTHGFGAYASSGVVWYDNFKIETI